MIKLKTGIKINVFFGIPTSESWKKFVAVNLQNYYALKNNHSKYRKHYIFTVFTVCLQLKNVLVCCRFLKTRLNSNKITHI